MSPIRRVWPLAACVVALFGGAAVAQPLDSLATAPLAPDSVASRTPRGAVTRSLLVPGLGQLYNREPVKAPIAAALVVGSVVYAVNRQRSYLRYRRATVYAYCLADPTTTPELEKVCPEALADYEDEWDALGMKSGAELEPTRNSARGQRDIGFLVVAVAYAFQAFDAYVAAELDDFDVSEDVAVRVDPGPRAPSVSLTVRL